MDLDEKCSLVKFQFAEKCKEDSILKKIFSAQGKCVTQRNVCGKLKLITG